VPESLSSNPKLTCTEGHAIQPAALEYVERLSRDLEARTLQFDSECRHSQIMRDENKRLRGALRRIVAQDCTHTKWLDIAREALRGADEDAPTKCNRGTQGCIYGDDPHLICMNVTP
jgi:hypothetical protein